MKKMALKSITWYGILALLVAVAILPLLKAAAPQFFPTLDGFRNVDCRGVTCAEGQFCQNNKCTDIAPRSQNVPTGDLVQ
jgi:hypothetical protein